MATWNPVKRSSLHHKHLALGAALEQREGWQQPARYSSAEQELEQLKGAAGLCDISSVGKVSVQGEQLGHLLTAAFPDATELHIGSLRQVKLGSPSDPWHCALSRLAVDEYLAVTPTGKNVALVEILEEDPDRCAHVVDLTSALAGVSIAGPSANLLLTNLIDLDLSDAGFPHLHCALSKIAGIHGTLLRRDIAGLLRYELYFTREFGEYMWDVLMEAGERYGAVPVGVEAKELLGA
jgi:sarcosine oxidase subunit alpha